MGSARLAAVLTAAVWGTAAQAEEAAAAAECAALYHAHHLYEVASFDPADVSDGWQAMARGFEAAANRLGASPGQMKAAHGRVPGWQVAITAHVLGRDAQAARQYGAQQAACDGLIVRLPDLAAYR
ncbi:MAG: hypothetical protein Q4G26_11635 [Paracoccus sp. (in: a-proteobacteria)]|nr:hypothetical protein [Paracoccus sp. (in: a-proteobacteria)]